MPNSVSASWWKIGDGGIEFAIRATPNARRSEVVGVVDEVVGAKVAAPPEGGRADDELCRVIADWFDVLEQEVRIVSVKTSPKKLIRIEGASLPPRL